MSEIYLPEKLVHGQVEKDLHPYHRRVSTSFCVAFTLNEPTPMNTGNKYKDNLDACLTAVSWVEDHFCEYESIGIGLNDPNHNRIVKTLTIYMDRGGYIVSGQYHELNFNMHSVEDNLPKKLTVKSNYQRKFKRDSEENLLHKEIFIDKVFNLEGMLELKINTQSDFYKLLQTVSIYNRSMDMSFVYSIAQEKQIEWEKFKKVIAVVSIPVMIEGYAWVKALQTGITLINYLCTADNVMKLSDKLFDFRGPVVISDVFTNYFTNMNFDPQRDIIPEPKIEDGGSDLRNTELKKLSALNDFLEIQTIVGNEIKKIKEPNI